MCGGWSWCGWNCGADQQTWPRGRSFLFSFLDRVGKVPAGPPRVLRMKRMLLAVFFAASVAFGADSKPLTDIPLKDIDGKPASLKDYSGKVLLLVNVASHCG